MQQYEGANFGGNLKIAKDVIATITRYAALEVEGVTGLGSFASNLRGWMLLKQSAAKPIVVELRDDSANIDLRVNIRSGVRIPVIAEKIQESVKEAVQSMTGLAVAHVNVEIADITFSEPHLGEMGIQPAAEA